MAEAIPDTDALRALDAAHDAAWAAVDPDLLALCRDRVAMLLRHEPTLREMDADRHHLLSSWPGSTELGELERAALAFAEQYVIDVAALSDEQVAALRDHLGDVDLVDFVNALLVVEQRMSLESIFDGVLG